MSNSRRLSGLVHLSTSETLNLYHSTQDHEDIPHATKRTMADHIRKFNLTPQRMRIIVEEFKEALELGLQKPNQVVPMIPTYVFGWPTGNEKGKYLAVDLGGTNLRVCLVILHGESKFDIVQSKFRLTEEQKHLEDGQELFDYCAGCLSEFIKGNIESGEIEEGEVLPLGFTFSYPCSQDRIDHGVLIRWTKGFGVGKTEGEDVAAMFKKSLETYNIPATLTALINDTTGALIASRYVNPRTKIAVIFGTGCNAAYMEKLADIPKLANLGFVNPSSPPPPQSDDSKSTETTDVASPSAPVASKDADRTESLTPIPSPPTLSEMAINCEWGAFDSFTHEHLPRTKYDKIVDETSNKPGEQAFEKLISGRYLGEILRLVIVDLIDTGSIFLGQNTYKLEIPYSFDTAFLSLMESDPTDELLMIIGIFTHFFVIETTLAERQFFKALAKMVGRRAARLSACGIAAIVGKMGYLEEGCMVGADGSLYNKYPGFAERVHEGLFDIFGERGRNIVTYHAEDGSGVGSAIIAAMTKKRKDEGLFVNY